MDRLQARLENVMTNLPDWTHGVAIKSCPLSGVLRQAQKLGFGAECASMGEVKHAIALGFEPSKIIYDSPVKTKDSFHSSTNQNVVFPFWPIGSWNKNPDKTNLEIAIKEGIYFNLDNVDEVLKVDDLLNNSCKGNLSEFSGPVRLSVRQFILDSERKIPIFSRYWCDW